MYVPRDEAFEELKQGSFLGGRLRAVLHTLVPSIMASISSENADFSSFHELEGLYKEGLLLKMGLQDHLLRKIPIVRQIQDSSQGLLRYDTPSILSSTMILLRSLLLLGLVLRLLQGFLRLPLLRGFLL